MTVSSLHRSSWHRPATSDSDGHAERVARGSLAIERRVVEKIASQSASEVAAAGGLTGGLFGMGSRADLTARPKVDVELTGRTATVGVAVALHYPAPIAEATGWVRRRIVETVHRLTGIEVTRVDVAVVSHLTRAGLRTGDAAAPDPSDGITVTTFGRITDVKIHIAIDGPARATAIEVQDRVREALADCGREPGTVSVHVVAIDRTTSDRS